MCVMLALKIYALLSHHKRVHREGKDFHVLYGINGCGRTFKSFFGYRSHMDRLYNVFLQNARNITRD